jgi:hypothetical protein
MIYILAKRLARTLMDGLKNAAWRVLAKPLNRILNEQIRPLKNSPAKCPFYVFHVDLY